MTLSREIHLKSRPVGMPTPDNFELVSVELPPPGPGQVQVRNQWMSVDPYMRGRMNTMKSYIPPFQIGAPLEGGAIGKVLLSNDPAFRPGDIVSHTFGWRECFNAKASALQKLDTHGLPAQDFLGVAGGVGLTAYAGLLRTAALKGGETVFISAAAGAVGVAACQIAKNMGCTVIGSAGGAEKVAFLKELGVDHVIDYKAESDLTAALAKAAPGGIDVYFDNVGGTHLEAALNAAKDFARFAMCGMISQYNVTEAPKGPSNFFYVITKSLRIEGFIVTNHLDMMGQYLRELVAWKAAGRFQSRETIEHGLENAVGAFLNLFEGKNIGKMLVKLSD